MTRHQISRTQNHLQPLQSNQSAQLTQSQSLPLSTSAQIVLTLMAIKVCSVLDILVMDDVEEKRKRKSWLENNFSGPVKFSGLGLVPVECCTRYTVCDPGGSPSLCGMYKLPNYSMFGSRDSLSNYTPRLSTIPAFRSIFPRDSTPTTPPFRLVCWSQKTGDTVSVGKGHFHNLPKLFSHVSLFGECGW